MAHFVIDGYNLIRSVDWMSTGLLRDQRDRLIRFIEEKRPHGSSNNRVTVVFDGRTDVTSPAYGGEVEVVFSYGPDADNVIKKRGDQAGNPRDMVVVTDDKSILKWVRGAGARVMSCADFLAAGRSVGKKARSGVRLTADDVKDINDELKELWKLK